jgi:hypothetical protein
MREKESERGREGQHSSASDTIYKKRRYWAQVVVKLEGPCEGGGEGQCRHWIENWRKRGGT